MRQLTYLVALDKHRHFARAAESCHVSQPALSAGISELERELGITIVKRNRSFQGITSEGERVLIWARQVLASLDGLRQEAHLVRNYLPSHDYAVKGGWNIADCVARSYDVEGMHFGTVAAGRIGLAVLRRLKPFGLHLHYTDPHRLKSELEAELRLTYHPDAASLVKAVDIVNLQMPLYPSTEHFFNDAMFAQMKRGTYLINTARGKLVDRDAVVRALKSGQLAGYAGDVWFPQPAPADHPWRTMPYNGMTPHISGTSLSAQARYAAGTLEILQSFYEGTPIRDEYLIVDGGMLAGTGAKSYKLT